MVIKPLKVIMIVMLQCISVTLYSAKLVGLHCTPIALQQYLLGFGELAGTQKISDFFL